MDNRGDNRGRVFLYLFIFFVFIARLHVEFFFLVFLGNHRIILAVRDRFSAPVVIDAVDTAPRSHYYYSQQGRGSVKGAVVTCIIRTVERFGLH